MNENDNRTTDKSQLAAFRKAARDLGADESKEGFENVLRTLAKAKPSPENTKGNAAKRRD